MATYREAMLAGERILRSRGKIEFANGRVETLTSADVVESSSDQGGKRLARRSGACRKIQIDAEQCERGVAAGRHARRDREFDCGQDLYGIGRVERDGVRLYADGQLCGRDNRGHAARRDADRFGI